MARQDAEPEPSADLNALAVTLAMRSDDIFAMLRADADEDRVLAKLDPLDTEHRRAVLGAIKRLIDEYILPAMDCPEAPDRFYTFDVDAVAGTRISGLVRAMLDESMSGLARRSDREIREAAEYVGVSLADAAAIDRFYRCWAANRAGFIVSSFLSFLEDGLLSGKLGLKGLALASEKAFITALRAQKLPRRIDGLLELAESGYANKVGDANGEKPAG